MRYPVSSHASLTVLSPNDTSWVFQGNACEASGSQGLEHSRSLLDVPFVPPFLPGISSVTLIF